MIGDLHDWLLADAPLAVLVGDRVFVGMRDEGDGMAALPAIVLWQVSPGRAYTHAGKDATHSPRIRADIWARSATERAAVNTALDNRMEALVRVTHTLVGLCANIGAQRAEGLARQANSELGALDWSDADAIVQLRALLNTLQDSVEAIVEQVHRQPAVEA